MCTSWWQPEAFYVLYVLPNNQTPTEQLKQQRTRACGVSTLAGHTNNITLKASP